jgi:hypothetical protein
MMEDMEVGLWALPEGPISRCDHGINGGRHKKVIWDALAVGKDKQRASKGIGISGVGVGNRSWEMSIPPSSHEYTVKPKVGCVYRVYAK